MLPLGRLPPAPGRCSQAFALVINNHSESIHHPAPASSDLHLEGVSFSSQPCYILFVHISVCLKLECLLAFTIVFLHTTVCVAGFLFPLLESHLFSAERLISPVSPHSDYCEDWPEAQRISASLLDSRSYETLVDFDNHLDDIRNDWTNPEINKAVLHLC